LKAAYVDSSSLLAIAFSEPGHERIAPLIDAYEQVFSSNLLEAELRAAMSREKVDVSIEELIIGVEWILPRRSLTRELKQTLSAGYLRGADLWHVACARYLASQVAPDTVQFVSLDRQQSRVANCLNGLQVDWLPED
jgi:predicted nucleic acid-binding protein